MLLFCLVGCSDEPAPEGPRGIVMEVVPGLSDFRSAPMPTRAGWLPVGYHTYDELMGNFASQRNLAEETIGIFFAQDGEVSVQGNFKHGADGKWRSDVDIRSAGTYYLYGFIPRDAAADATLAPSTTYADGAVLTLRGLDYVTSSDVCVIVGAKEGLSANTVENLRTGQFAYTASGGEQNYVFLLFDHIASALRFRFRVGKDYDALRTIRLKRVELLAYADATYTKGAASKVDARITLAANGDDLSPIRTVEFTPDEASGEQDAVVLYADAEGVELREGEYTDFRGSFVPSARTYMALRTQYDVYDKQGHLVRQDCTAENRIDMGRIFDIGSTEGMRGTMYSLNLTVSPTYLYVLADPDLDSPSVELES